MRLSLVAVLMAGPAMADPLVDLPTLFQQHADKAVVISARRETAADMCTGR